MKKLVCDRCGAELKDKDDIDLACEGETAWQTAARTRGTEPRGILPCQHFARCGGEMLLIVDRRVMRWWQRLKRISGR